MEEPECRELSPAESARLGDLFDRHADPLTSLIAHQYTHSHSSAEDAVQDAIYEMMRQVRSGELELFKDTTDDDERLRSWLYHAAIHRAIDGKRSAGRRMARETRYYERMETPTSTDPADEERLKVLRERVSDTLDRLSETERKLLSLAAEGYTYKELAAILGINGVGMRLTRARAAFRELYTAESNQ